MLDRIVVLTFVSQLERRSLASPADLCRQHLLDLGIHHHSYEEGTQVRIFERENPDWDFDTSFFRILKYMLKREGMSNIFIQYDS